MQNIIAIISTGYNFKTADGQTCFGVKFGFKQVRVLRQLFTDFHFNFNPLFMKFHPYLIALLFFSASIFSQTNSYYYKGQKIPLQVDKRFLNISATNSFSNSSISSLNIKENNIVQKTSEKFGSIEFTQEPSDVEFLQKINTLRQNPNINNVSLFYKRGNGAKPLGTSNVFYVKLKKESDFAVLQQQAILKNINIVKNVPNMPTWYIVKLTKQSPGTSIELSNYFFETNLFEEVDPAFMFEFKHDTQTVVTDDSARPSQNTNPSFVACIVNDPSFSQQWALNYPAYPQYDINACQAWDLSKGLNTRIAIIDTGIEKTHGDLAANINPLSYNAQTGTSPSITYSSHGTEVAGIAGAVLNNNLQIAGVAPQARIIDVSHSLWISPTYSSEIADGITWAVNNGADVINCSFGDNGGFHYNAMYSVILENAIINAMVNGRGGLGTVVAFAAGNFYQNINYPGNFDARILTVGSSTQWGGTSLNQGYALNGDRLDVVAPGFGVFSTTTNNNILNGLTGTSVAAPHGAGVASLVISKNPCLTRLQVVDIIEQSCQKIQHFQQATSGTNIFYNNVPQRPNGTHSLAAGYGLIDAYAAVLLAQNQGQVNHGLVIRDSPSDSGAQPNTTTQFMWNSEDIWVRNAADNGTVHQNPEYSPAVPNHIYVRITNRSCFNSIGNKSVKLYWAKAGTSLDWDASWSGSAFQSGQIRGNEIATIAIPALNPGQEVILSAPWTVANPANYIGMNPEPWHFCLLARIVEPYVPMAFPETTNLNSNVQNNNKIAWKNVTVVDVLSNKLSGVVAVGNPFDHPRAFYLELIKEDLETGKPIYEEAEVSIKMDPILYAAWERGGKIATKLDGTLDAKEKLVTGNQVLLNNLLFNANEVGTLNLSFNFLTEELTNKSKFVYHVIQKDKLTNEIIGGETYVINKEPRSIFEADAGATQQVNSNEPITISAAQINEPAIYNWYDSEGVLVFQGKDLTIATEVATKYKLEVIATADGFKDYAEVEVKIKPSIISSLTPNPATNAVTVSYKVNQSSSAYLMIIGGYGTTSSSNNYIINTLQSDKTIDISAFANGFYTVALVVGGQILDAKTLIKQ